MRKEPIIAIIIGSLFGVFVAFSLWRMSQTGAVEPQTENAKQEENTTKTHTGFSIVSPSDNSVTRDSTVTISGFGIPESIVVSYAKNISLAKVDSSGEFKLKTDLSEGTNNISIWSIEKGQEPVEQSLDIVYSANISEETNKPVVSITGAITDIAEDTLQIRTMEGKIEQLSIDELTSFASVAKDEEIEFGDLAIGDFITALGEPESDSVMKAIRVLVGSEEEAKTSVVIVGTVSILNRNEFIVSSNGNEVSVDATGSVDVYSANLETTRLGTAVEGDEIIIIGTFDKEELSADTIILF